MSKTISESLLEYSTSSARRASAAVGLSLIVGAGMGLIVEGNTNQVAKGKIVTVETCMDITPHEETVTQELVNCFEDGLPVGNTVDKNIFEEGQPIQLVDSYVESQRSEAETIEINRMVLWTAAPLAATAVAVTVFGL